MACKTFKHSGDLGDIIFSLPAMRALGGGILYLDPAGGVTEPHVRITCFPERATRLTAASIEWLKPLLLQQEYITDVRHWSGDAVNTTWTYFAATRGKVTWPTAICWPSGSSSNRDTVWLKVDQPHAIDGFTKVICRTSRKHGNDQFWQTFLNKHQQECLFVGLEPEHKRVRAEFWHL